MKSIPKVSIRQIKAARALLGWSQEDLAAMAGVSVPTVKRLEAADGLLGGRENTAIKLRTALERAGIEFTNGIEPGVGLKWGAKLDVNRK
jgi:transcriptional regulator with XRE-family HTH domain